MKLFLCLKSVARYSKGMIRGYAMTYVVLNKLP